MTIVEFAEKVLDMKLYSYQKKFLETVYEKYKRGEPLIITYPKGHVVEMDGFRRLALMYCDSLERGELDDDKIEQVQT